MKNNIYRLIAESEKANTALEQAIRSENPTPFDEIAALDKSAFETFDAVLAACLNEPEELLIRIQFLLEKLLKLPETAGLPQDIARIISQDSQTLAAIAVSNAHFDPSVSATERDGCDRRTSLHNTLVSVA